MSEKPTRGLARFILAYLTKHLKHPATASTGNTPASAFSTPPATPPRPPVRAYSQKSKTTRPKRTRKLRDQMANSIASRPGTSPTTVANGTKALP